MWFWYFEWVLEYIINHAKTARWKCSSQMYFSFNHGQQKERKKALTSRYAQEENRKKHTTQIGMDYNGT